MKKRFAIPVEGTVLSEHFGHCQGFAFVDTDDKQITNVFVLDPPEHQPGTFPRWVAQNKATDVIAGGIGPKAVDLFNQFGINVFVGAPVLTPEVLVQKFLANELQLNANYCDHHGDDDHHHDHHHHH